MGLSGPKRRTKLSSDPNNTAWSKSTDGFGHKILLAQGWKPGQLLGAKDAAHAEHFTAANASHIRVVLREDNLGLGAQLGKGNAETFGLSTLSGIFGRLNGKSDSDLEKQQSAQRDAELRAYQTQKFGYMTFVRGGLLLGDKMEQFDVEAVAARAGKPKEKNAITEVENEKRSKRKREDMDDPKLEEKKKKRRSDKDETKLNEKKKKRRSDKDETKLDEKKKKRRSDKDETKLEGKKKKKEKKSHKDNGIPQDETSAASGTLDVNIDTSVSKKHKDDKAARKAEKRARKEERKQRREDRKKRKESHLKESTSEQEDTSSSSDTGVESKTIVHQPITAATFAGSRQAVRQRFIQQKRLASMDAKALNEILMMKTAVA